MAIWWQTARALCVAWQRMSLNLVSFTSLKLPGMFVLNSKYFFGLSHGYQTPPNIIHTHTLFFLGGAGVLFVCRPSLGRITEWLTVSS